jgi:Na+-driven multidrug efflux pump
VFAKFVNFCRDVIKFDELALEILSIALPAALALAADPIASLVDSAFVGHIGIYIFFYLNNLLIWKCLINFLIELFGLLEFLNIQVSDLSSIAY